MTLHNATPGFTLIELLTALTLVAITLNSAVYGYRTWQQRSLMTEHLTLWINTLRFARNYALISGKTATLCPSIDATQCSGNDYAKGWLVFVENPSSQLGYYDGDERIIASSHAWHPSLTLRSNFTTPIRFDYAGRTNANGRFVMCFDGDTDRMRGLFLIRSGRLRLAQHSELSSCLL